MLSSSELRFKHDPIINHNHQYHYDAAPINKVAKGR